MTRYQRIVEEWEERRKEGDVPLSWVQYSMNRLKTFEEKAAFQLRLSS